MTVLTQAQCDAAYDNGAAVLDVGDLTARRIAASAAWRAAHPAHLDIPYAPAVRTKWDLFPAADPAAPCFVFVHGGWWQFGAREENAVAAAGLSAHGWSVALPGYTLAPEASLTRIVGEIGTALDWLRDNGAAHGISGPVLLAGWSAGALLAILNLSHPTVRAGLAFSGAYELGPIRDTYLDAKLRLTGAEIAALSPLRLPPTSKPLSLAFGADELAALVSDGRALHAHRRAVDPVGRVLALAGLNHFTIYHALTEPDGALVREALRLASRW
ncbi:alpha/beta hydrolase [uncultured Methylobacterium sp.]|uniref:alpha/beta hydrolase n=1 Tax=uncultured Methylobacterium sp. TaxID=157278 RepID=UPI0035C987CE